MSDRGTADQDLFQIWLANSRAFFATDSADGPISDSLKQKCEGLFTAWNRFAQTYAQAGSGGIQGGPFDPIRWVDTAGDGGFGDLGHWAGVIGGSTDGANFWRDQRDAFTGSRQWAVYITALERYRAVMGTAWLKAFNRFTEELAQETGAQATAPGGHPNWQVIQACWQRAASAELATAQRSEDFLAAQRDLIRARLDCSALLRERTERITGALGLPTRAEVDDLHENLHSMKRELRALRARLDSDR